MSGLFRRLARQASGQAARLHAPARLPFYAAPAATEALDPAEAPSPTEAPPPAAVLPTRPRPTPMPATLESPDDGAGGGPPPSWSRDDADASPAFTLRCDDDPQEAPPQPANAAPAHRSTRRPGASASLQKGPAPIAPRRPAETPPRTAAPLAPAPGLAPRTADRVANRPVDRTAATGALDTAAPFEAPPTLLPSPSPPRPGATRSAADAASPRSPAADRTAAQARATAEGPNEVHVHIGRIDVTAVQQPAPTPRAEKRGPTPMSLDEYLARRQRGSS